MSIFVTAFMALTYTTALVTWTFIVLYHVLSRGTWRRDPLGRHLMALAGVDAAIFTMLSVADWLPRLAAARWFDWAYLVVVSGIAVTTAWRAAILWRLYHPRRRG